MTGENPLFIWAGNDVPWAFTVTVGKISKQPAIKNKSKNNRRIFETVILIGSLDVMGDSDKTTMIRLQKKPNRIRDYSIDSGFIVSEAPINIFSSKMGLYPDRLSHINKLSKLRSCEICGINLLPAPVSGISPEATTG